MPKTKKKNTLTSPSMAKSKMWLFIALFAVVGGGALLYSYAASVNVTSFYAWPNPTSSIYGHNTTVYWSSTGASRCTIWKPIGNVGPNGWHSYYAGTGYYGPEYIYIQCFDNHGNSSATKELTITNNK